MNQICEGGKGFSQLPCLGSLHSFNSIHDIMSVHLCKWLAEGTLNHSGISDWSALGMSNDTALILSYAVITFVRMNCNLILIT